MMAEVAAELADLTVLTAEDPRTESLEEILDEMAAGARLRADARGDILARRGPWRSHPIRGQDGAAR